MTSESKIHSLFTGIDLLRFLLSVIILLAHFPHFGSQFTPLNQLNHAQLPFYTFLFLFYDYGGYAVQIFWMISGVVFYNFYYHLIEGHKLSFKKFICFRVSKLYPVHFLTLLTVFFLQGTYYNMTDRFFVYQNFDALHFLLNLFMISYWNARYGLSFNGPFWSVSVEIFVYIIFYLTVYLGLLNSPAKILRIVFIFFTFFSIAILSPFHECLFFFFTGVFLASKKFLFQIRALVIAAFFCGVSIILFKYSYILSSSSNLYRVLEVLFKLSLSFFSISLFAISFIRVNGKVESLFRKLSSITYSVYMIHFSVQLILVLLFQGQKFSFFNSNLFLFIYLAASIILGTVVYYSFERVLQRTIRQKFGFHEIQHYSDRFSYEKS